MLEKRVDGFPVESNGCRQAQVSQRGDSGYIADQRKPIHNTAKRVCENGRRPVQDSQEQPRGSGCRRGSSVESERDVISC